MASVTPECDDLAREPSGVDGDRTMLRADKTCAMKTQALLCTVMVAGLHAPALEVPLTVQEAVGVPRRGAPVSSGICFPRGVLRTNQLFSLWAGDREVPVQVSPLVIQPDGSLRWALLDFQVDLGAKESRQFVLRTEAPRVQSGSLFRSPKPPRP
jgi:hypothetical protein